MHESEFAPVSVLRNQHKRKRMRLHNVQVHSLALIDPCIVSNRCLRTLAESSGRRGGGEGVPMGGVRISPRGIVWCVHARIRLHHLPRPTFRRYGTQTARSSNVYLCRCYQLPPPIPLRIRLTRTRRAHTLSRDTIHPPHTLHARANSTLQQCTHYFLHATTRISVSLHTLAASLGELLFTIYARTQGRPGKRQQNATRCVRVRAEIATRKSVQRFAESEFLHSDSERRGRGAVNIKYTLEMQWQRACAY